MPQKLTKAQLQEALDEANSRLRSSGEQIQALEIQNRDLAKKNGELDQQNRNLSGITERMKNLQLLTETATLQKLAFLDGKYAGLMEAFREQRPKEGSSGHTPEARLHEMLEELSTSGMFGDPDLGCFARMPRG